MVDALKSALVAAAIAGIIVVTAGAATPFIAGFAGAFGIASAGAAFVTFAAVSAFVATGINMMLAPDPPQVATENFGTKASNRDANAPRQIVYGETRVGGTITQMESTGADNNKLSLFIVIAGHEIESLERVFINDSTVVLGTHTVSSTVSGETVHEVNLAEFIETENTNAFTNGRLIRFTFHDGSQTARDGLAAATLGTIAVPTTHKFTNCAYVYMELIYDPEKNGSVPQISFQVKGKNIFDPRSNALSTTDAQRSNPALIIRDFLTDTVYGLKATTSEINDTTSAGGFASAANTCDQTVTIQNSATETRYTCNGFTNMTADANEFIQACLSSMAGSLTYSNGKFNCFAGANQTASLTITDDDCLTPLQVSKKSLSGGLFNTAKAIFTDKANNFIGADAPIIQNSTFLAQDTPSGESTANYVKTMELRLPMTQSVTMAQRLSKIALEHQRQTTVVSGLFSMEFMKLQPKDYVQVTNSRLSFTNKLFEVVSVTLDIGEADGVQFLATKLELKEIDPSVYDFAVNEYSTPITTIAVQNTGASALQGVTGASRTQTATKEGVQTKINILVSWTVRADPTIVATEVQFKLNSESSYKSITTGPKQENAVISNVAVGEVYNIRLRNIGKNGEVSAFTVLSDLTINAVSTAPNAPSNLTAASDNPLLIGLSWTFPSDADLRAVKIYRKTSNNTPTDDTDLVETIYGEPGSKGLFFFGKHDGLSAGTVYYFWMRSINHSGVHSSFTASVNGSFKNIVAGDVDATFSNTIAFKSNLTDGSTIISGSNIQTGTLNATTANLSSLNVGGASITGSMGNSQGTIVISNSAPTNRGSTLVGLLNSTYVWGNVSTDMENIVNFAFTTSPNHAGGGNKSYLVIASYAPVGAAGAGSESLQSLAVYTSSATHPTATPVNSAFDKYITTGAITIGVKILAVTLSLPQNTTHYAKLYGKFNGVVSPGFGSVKLQVIGMSV